MCACVQTHRSVCVQRGGGKHVSVSVCGGSPGCACVLLLCMCVVPLKGNSPPPPLILCIVSNLSCCLSPCSSSYTGLIQPELLPDGQVCVDMGEPILEGPKVPTTLAPTQGSTVVQQTLEVDGRKWALTCVSMGNPHAITYSVDGQPIKVRTDGRGRIV